MCLCFPTLHKVKVTVFSHYKVALGNKKKISCPTIQYVFNVGAISRSGIHFFCFSKTCSDWIHANILDQGSTLVVSFYLQSAAS